jgi:hypothetical protein
VELIIRTVCGVLTALSLLMCADADEIRSRARWDGAAGVSRRALLSSLQRKSFPPILARMVSQRWIGYIPSSIMIPPRRMAVLITQAQTHQRQQCTYHNVPLPGALPGVPGDSLYVDHACDTAAFPRVTTLILDEHTDEVWNLNWSHSGTHLATGGRDKRAIIWSIGVSLHPWFPHSFLPIAPLGSPRRTRQYENARCSGISPIMRTLSTEWRGRWTTQYCSPPPSNRSRCGILR